MKSASFLLKHAQRIENPAASWYYFYGEQKKAIRRTERYEHVMTIQECYAQMGADYNEVFRRLYNEAMIRKFVLLFPKDDSFHNLEAALKEQNVK